MNSRLLQTLFSPLVSRILCNVVACTYFKNISGINFRKNLRWNFGREDQKANSYLYSILTCYWRERTFKRKIPNVIIIDGKIRLILIFCQFLPKLLVTKFLSLYKKKLFTTRSRLMFIIMESK